jgi:tRNA dimethylallyltransferase
MPDRLIAVVGATATGKTSLALQLAHALNGEIVNADSRQVYRGMDIGTAKPSAGERERTPHWLLDIVAPDEAYTLAAFLDDAHAALADIWSRGKRPILVGGTGQYVWAIVEGWSVPRVPPDHALRARLEAMAARYGTEAVARELMEIDPASAAAIDHRNLRRVIRAIEVTRGTGKLFSESRAKVVPSFETSIVGLTIERSALHTRIDVRVDAMIDAGLVDEVRRLNAVGYPCHLPAMQSIGYRQICQHLRGDVALEDAVARIKTETHRLARMQHTWFRADDERIAWLDATSADLVATALSILGSVT